MELVTVKTHNVVNPERGKNGEGTVGVIT